MLVDGMILTAPQQDILRPGPRGVRAYDRDRCNNGYTLFSTAFGSEEYLIDIVDAALAEFGVDLAIASETVFKTAIRKAIDAATERGVEVWFADKDSVMA